MRKAISCAMLASIASGGAFAQSSVTFSGVVDLYTGRVQYAGQPSNTKLESGGLQTSRFSIFGKEDLGDGLSALFDLSGFFRADSGQSGRFSGIPGIADDSFFSRRALVGLDGAFGTVTMGRGSTPYMISLVLFNPLGDSSAFSPMFMHNYTGGQNPQLPPPNLSPVVDTAASNMIQYSTPSFDGLRGHFQYSLGEVAGNTSKNRISASINYMNGPVGMSAATDRFKMPAFPMEDMQTAYIVGAYYDFGVAKVFGQYAQTRQKFIPANSDRKYATTQLGAAIPISVAAKFLMSWGHTKIELPLTGVSAYMPTSAFPIPAATPTSGVSPKRDTYTLVYDYCLSKRTDLYAVAMSDRYTGLNSGLTAALGIRHGF